MKVITNEILITPDIAMDILQNNHRNRKMNKELVLLYADQMSRGLWKFNGESIIISDENILLNGQHRLGAIIKSGTSQKFIVVQGISQAAFDTIDTGKTRTAGDILSIANIKESTKISSIITRFFGVSVSQSRRESLLRSRRSKQEVLSEYQSNPDFWRAVLTASSRLYRRIRLLSQSDIGGYIAYLVKEKGHDFNFVESFFNQLFFDTDIENSTIPLLRDKLIRSITTQYKISSRLRHALIVKTWNAYVDGKEYKRLSFDIDKEEIQEFL